MNKLGSFLTGYHNFICNWSFLLKKLITINNIQNWTVLGKMNIITYFRELFCYFMNKKVDQYESNSEVKTEHNKNIYRYSTISDLSILGKKIWIRTFYSWKEG